MPRSKKRRGTHNKINTIKPMYDLSKYTVWVVRIPGGDNSKSVLRDAAPCSKCCKGLLNLGFRKVGYSTNDGDIEIIDLRNYHTKHLSNAQVKSEKYCRYSYY